MSRGGFYISRLVISGLGMKPAEVAFDRGANVITGPSNTGKSYIVECLDFVFGASSPPGSDIEEARGYDVAYVELTCHSGTVYTLERGLGGGDVNLYESNFEGRSNVTPRPLAVEAQTRKTETLSAFLLSLFDVRDITLRTDGAGTKGNLTFRTISHLFLIDESRIIAKTSPIRLPNGFAKTSSERAFNFLITGQDDHAIISTQKLKERKAANAGKKEVFDELISKLTEALTNVDLGQIRSKAAELDESIKEKLDGLGASTESIREMQVARQTAFELARVSDARLSNISDLLARFEILKQHYVSDLKRLEFLKETDHFFDQLTAIRCPLCGSSLESHAQRKMCVDNEATMNDVQGACAAESAKNEALLRDLQRTIDGLETERISVKTTSETQRSELNRIDSSLGDELRPSFAREKATLEKLSEQKQHLASIEAQFQTLEQYRIARSNLDEPIRSAPVDFAGLNLSAARSLADVVQDLLHDWRFLTASEVVEMNERLMDLVIDGKPRQSNGKGLRAFLYSAFAIGLMHFCRSEDLPHPGTIVMDSPLTSYREGRIHEAEDEAEPEIQSAFWESVSGWTENEQLILIENKEPTASARSRMNYIHFFGKGSSEGRNGLFPSRLDL